MKFYTYTALYTALRSLSSRSEPTDDSMKEDEDEERVTVRLYDMPMLVIWVMLNPREDVIKHILYVMSMIDHPIDEEVKCLVWVVRSDHH